MFFKNAKRAVRFFVYLLQAYFLRSRDYRFKNKALRIVTGWREFRELKGHIGGRRGLYNFTISDLKLFKCEKIIKPPAKSAVSIGGGFKIISIRNHEIFWPDCISDSELPWLYREVFDPYNCNPSSYDHPGMEYGKAEWVIDAGCCEGFFSLFAFNENDKCRIIALEPLPAMGPCLKKTFESRIKSKQFILEQRAIGKETGVAKYQFDAAHLCESAVFRPKGINTNGPHIYFDVNVTSIDELFRLHNLNQNGVIKMDIEGAEMDALTGGKELLKKYKPKLAVAVYHEYENALKCRKIVLDANPEYTVEFRGMYGFFKPPRPYMMFAW